MSGGAVINVVIFLGLTPIVARLFDTEQFGVFAIFSSTLVMLNTVVSGMFPHALILPKVKTEYLSLLSLCFGLAIIGTGIFGLLMFVFKAQILSLINGDELTSYYLYLPLGLFILSIHTILTNWTIRRKEFKTNAVSNISASISSRSFQIAYGFGVGNFFGGLIFSELISKTVGVLTMWKKDMSKDISNFSLLKKQDILDVIKKYKRYPTYILGANIVNSSTVAIPFYMVAGGFGIGAVGAFSMAQKILAIPYTALGNSITPVYFQKANELIGNKENVLSDLTKSTYNKLLILSSIIYGFVVGFGDILFFTFLGEKWLLAGQMAQILAIYYVFQMISSPFSKLFWIYKREDISLKMNILRAVLRVCSIYIGIETGSLIDAILFFSVANLIGYLVMNIYVLKFVKLKIPQVLFRTILVCGSIMIFYYLFRLLCEYFLPQFFIF